MFSLRSFRPQGVRPALRRRFPAPSTFSRPHAQQTPKPSPSAAIAQAVPRHQPFYAPILRALNFYGRSQRRFPWRTQILTAITINALGDLNAQLCFGEPGSGLDPLRTLRMMFTGFVFAIPSNEWYTRISMAFSGLPKLAAVSLRVAISQLIFSPMFLFTFFAAQGVLEGLSLKDVETKIRNTFRKAYLDSLKLWPAVGFLNFWLVPLEFRALVGGGAALLWNTYLSWLNAKGRQMVKDVEEMPEKKVLQPPAVNLAVAGVKQAV